MRKKIDAEVAGVYDPNHEDFDKRSRGFEFGVASPLF